MDKQALMIYNPFSGKKRTHKAFPTIINELSNHGYQLTVQKMEGRHCHRVKHSIQQACQNRWEAIFVAGGDGTVNAVLQCLAEESYRPHLGVLPFGTSNEFARYLGLSSNVFQALAEIGKQVIHPIDIGKFGDQYFANIASAGWLSDITYKTSPFMKAYLGEWAYVLFFFKSFLLTRPSHPMSIHVSTDEVISDLSLFMIMNGNRLGPLKRLIDHDIKKAGSFHLLVCKKTSRWKVFLSLLALILPVKTRPSMIHHTSIQSGFFNIPACNDINLDGEQSKVQHFQFDVLPQHLHVFHASNIKKTSS